MSNWKIERRRGRTPWSRRGLLVLYLVFVAWNVSWALSTDWLWGRVFYGALTALFVVTAFLAARDIWREDRWWTKAPDGPR